MQKTEIDTFFDGVKQLRINKNYLLRLASNFSSAGNKEISDGLKLIAENIDITSEAMTKSFINTSLKNIAERI